MARVTFVNGHWQGLQVPVDADPATLHNSCPMVWEYLDSAGRDGWELVSTVTQSLNPADGFSVAVSLLFLKKEVPADAAPA
jgi:hypothetical protein